MSCGLRVRGFKTYCCSNNECTHTKTVTFGCKSRFCPTCGKKATDIWINKQQNIMPKIPFQHITFTMPDKLWPLFKKDPKLLNQLPKLAADVIQKIAKNRNIKVGIFVAVHTFGRDLQWHVHIHLSVSMAGLTSKHQYKEIKFSKKQVEPMWRYRVIKLFKAARVNKTINVTNAFLELQYFKKWIIHFAKPSKSPWRSITYLGRYVKRPPLSQSRLAHYDGREVTFNYLNHRNGKYKDLTLSTVEFIKRFIQHIPEKGFRMIRYYGFLANRVRSSLLPIIYELIDQTPKEPKFIGWAGLFKQSFGKDPLECILCQSKMKLTNFTFPMTKAQLHTYHEKLATRSIIN